MPGDLSVIANIDLCPDCPSALRTRELVEIEVNGRPEPLCVARVKTVCRQTGEIQPFTCPGGALAQPRQAEMLPVTHKLPIISFAWTTPAIEARRKTCTRRDWDDGYAARFSAGQLVAGYDKNPRYGGRRIVVLRLTEKPYREAYRDAPGTDYEAEGFAYLESIKAHVHGRTPLEFWNAWKARPASETCYVVRFEYANVVP